MRGREVMAVLGLVGTVALAMLVGAESSSAHPAGPDGAFFDRAPRILFDGATLEGWTTTGGRYDGDASWSVEDGALTGRTGEKGEGGLIYTTRSFTSFDLALECKLEYPYDSGVFVRMLPPGSELKGAQVTLDHRDGGEIAAIYADGFLEHNEAAGARFHKNEWNSVRVRCTEFDAHIQVWINGEQVTDYRLPPGTPGFATRGLIGLQVHPADADARSRRVQFRDIRVHELDVFEFADPDGALLAKPNAGVLKRALGGLAPSSAAHITARSADDASVLVLTDAARSAGWRELFEDGFETVGTAEGYSVEASALAIPSDGSGHIVTKADFTDFRLRVDFKIAEMANSGLFLRGARGGGDPAYSGCEIQILDDFNWEERTQSKLAPYQFTGSLYAAAAAGPDKEYARPGEWNRYEVLYRGTRLAAALNGRLLFDVETGALEVEPAFAARAATGFIGFQRYGADSVNGSTALWVRNAFVQPLAPLVPPAPPAPESR